ncbi:hypothetical protein OPQ81_002832 [Rhizoctonia solani]|nr:hypothetical protein OPQ81_002832 [Rhizoctonia solani]
MATSLGKEAEILEFFSAAEKTKVIALIASTILVYDIVLTLPAEIRYIWSMRWSFARVAFHMNRLWGLLLLGVYVPTLFMHNLNTQVCIVINTYYIYGTAVTATIVAIIIIMRVWIIYGKKTWMLIALVLGSLAVSIPSLVLLQMRARSSKFIPNPAPEIIAGCTLKASLFGVGAYIGPLIYETSLFLLTLYKTWRTSSTPLMKRLMNDGSKYYAIVLGTLVIIGLGSINKQTKRAFLSSGLLVATFSAMCSRLILSGLSYYDDTRDTMSDLEGGTSGSILFVSNIAGKKVRERTSTPRSSSSSLAEPVQSLTHPQTRKYDSTHALVSEHDKGVYDLKSEGPPWNPYTDPFTANDPHGAGDSVPLVTFSSSPSNHEESPQSIHVIPKPRPAGWLRKFEPVPVTRLLIHMILCFLSFPVVFLVSRAASGMSLFWTRLIVGGLCGGVGLTLGISLLDLSRSCIEAALWATIIHESLEGELNKELDYHTHNPLSPWSAVLLLYKRYLKQLSLRNRKAMRRHDDRTPWWLCIVLFLVTATVAASLVFALGRVVDIYTVQQTQTKEYYEAVVAGDISAEEVVRAASVLNNTLSKVAYTWTITPLSSAQHVPTDRYFYLNRTEKEGNVITTTTETIHFAETFASQLAPNRPVGQIVRWPRWGSRIGCQIVEDLGRYLTPHSTRANMTYLFVPWKSVNSIFDRMGLPQPTAADFPPVNFTAFMEGADRPNVTAEESEVALMSKWWDNGVTHSFNWFPVSRGEDGNGWVSIEIVMIRLNQSYTAENSSFQVYGELGSGRTRIGFDAAICVEEVRGYVVDAYNSSAGSPISISLQYSGTQLNTSAVSLDEDPSKHEAPKRTREPLSIPGLQYNISSAGKFAVYNAAHYNARNIMIKDNGRDWWFAPNPTAVAFGGGNSPTEYTKLNPDNVAKIFANSDSQHLLPYLVGSQPVLAHVYPDKTVAYTYVYTSWLAIILAIVLVDGIIVSVFVPRLPLGVSRRDIGVTSWLAAIEDDPSAQAHLSPLPGKRFGNLQRRVNRWGSQGH